jgi:hypothetical protein
MRSNNNNNNNDVINFYETKAVKELNNNLKNPTEKITGIDYGSRVLVCSGSGGGKTNFVCNFLKNSPNTFHRMIFLVKQKDEPLYLMIEKKLKKQDVKFITNPNDIGSLNEKDNNYIRKGLDPDEQILLIIDDFMSDIKKNEGMFDEIFLRGRKKKITTMLLQQSYVATSRDIRRNCTHLVLLKLSGKRDINNILREAVPMIDNPKQFIKLFSEITLKPLDFMKIHMHSTDRDKMVSKNFTLYIPFDELNNV